MSSHSTAARNTTQAMMSLIVGPRVAQAIYIIAKLGVPDLLTAGPRSAAELAAEVAVHPRALYRIMRALAGIGIFRPIDQERFALTPLAEVLRSDAPHSLRTYAIMNGEQWVWQSLGAIEHSVRTGNPAFEHVFGAPLFTYYDKHPEASRVSREALNSLSLIENAAIVAAYDFPPAGTVVDIGGGQGSLLAAILEARPGLRGVLFERPPVAHAVRTRLAGTPISNQFEAVAGDFFAGIVTYGDLFVLKKVLHDWDDSQARAILMQCRTAMRPNARLLVIEAVLPEDNRPSPAHWLDLLMMVYSGGTERTEAEYRTLLASAGFSVTRVIPTKAVVSLVEALPNYRSGPHYLE